MATLRYRVEICRDAWEKIEAKVSKSGHQVTVDKKGNQHEFEASQNDWQGILAIIKQEGVTKYRYFDTESTTNPQSWSAAPLDCK